MMLMRSWYLPLMRCLMNASAAATVVKNVASFGAFLFKLAAGKRAIMLDEASIITAMRRPGNDTSSRVIDENGSARAIAKKGSPARNTRSAPWRMNDVEKNVGPALHLSTAGSATCVRPAFARVTARAGTASVWRGGGSFPPPPVLRGRELPERAIERFEERRSLVGAEAARALRGQRTRRGGDRHDALPAAEP